MADQLVAPAAVNCCVAPSTTVAVAGETTGAEPPPPLPPPGFPGADAVTGMVNVLPYRVPGLASLQDRVAVPFGMYTPPEMVVGVMVGLS